MKNCPSCGVSICGNPKICPLCHGALQGEPSESIWPARKHFKRYAAIYKLQMFLVLCIVVLFLSYDFLLRDAPAGSVHFSIPIAVWAIVFELELKRSIHRVSSPAKFTNYILVLILLLLIFTAWIMGFLELCLTVIVPIVLAVLLIFNFIASLFGRNHRALPYLLCNIVAGIVPYLLQFLIWGRDFISYEWAGCMVIGVVSLLGILIFRGRRTRDEVLKRVHM